VGFSVHPDHIMPLPRLPDYWRPRAKAFNDPSTQIDE
jgi:hypothetical protein